MNPYSALRDMRRRLSSAMNSFDSEFRLRGIGTPILLFGVAVVALFAAAPLPDMQFRAGAVMLYQIGAPLALPAFIGKGRPLIAWSQGVALTLALTLFVSKVYPAFLGCGANSSTSTGGLKCGSLGLIFIPSLLAAVGTSLRWLWLAAHGELGWRPLPGLSYLKIAATVVLCALVPMAVADSLRSSPWDFNQPPWSWSLIAILPLAALIASLLILRIPAGFWRIFAIVVALHALFVVVLKWRGLWPIFCAAMLWSDALLFVAVLPAAIAQRSPRWAGASTMFWTGLFFGAGVILGYAEELIITRAAESIAGDLPYCIQTASQANAFDYEEARSLFELNGLKMRVRQGSCGVSECFTLQNHAILAVEGPAYYHWSYGSQSFVPEHMPGPRCKLKPHFAQQLPAW